ncbi:MAG: UvrD-helicase domain-containing protein [Burkholderiaceae bacterium]
MTTDLLRGLNEQQLAAVTLPAQHALILAGAGSGKTRVLTTRIAWLISSSQLSPQGLLAVTFTNKAAREMLTRLSAMVTINTKAMWVGTFHGLCNRMLRAHYRDAGLPASFQILDSQDQLAAIKRMLKALQVDEDKIPPRNLMHFINACKENGQRAAAVEAFDDYNRRFVELYAAYEVQCQREGVVDFAELLLRSYELLQRNQLLREHYQLRFRHILVDEFQDTNSLQYRWLKLLAGAGNVVFAVGDDDQSIYGFRGADVGNMMAFEREFRVENLIKLEQNYRSAGHILDCANALIAHNHARLGKDLWTDAGEGEAVRVQELVSDAGEAQWLVEQIKAIVRDGDRRSDVAVLYRSNAQSRVIEHALFSANIPYRVYGGLRFFERAEVKHALAYLRLIEQDDDDGAFLRVVNFPTRGIGARSLEQLQDLASRQSTSLMGALGRASSSDLSSAALSRLRQFQQLIHSLRQSTAMMPLADAVELVIEQSGLAQHYSLEKEGQERLENLQELVNAAASFVMEQGFQPDTPLSLVTRSRSLLDADGATAMLTGPATLDDGTMAPIAETMSPLAAFLSHASLEAGEHQALAGDDAVQMMTVHAAKGLEFQHVFITGLEEGLFPHENALSEAQGLEEERRLMYVAITRARERLYLSFAQTRMLHGQTRYHLRSRFLEELPDQHLKWLSPRTQQRWGQSGGAMFGSTWGASASVSSLGVEQASRHESITTTKSSVPAMRIGQSVRHDRFGDGVVVSLEGRGADARAQINFGRQGLKWLALSVAKLQLL